MLIQRWVHAFAGAGEGSLPEACAGMGTDEEAKGSDVSQKINLGGWVNGGWATLDLDRLMETRALIQANSGGGKSWMLRRVLEQTAGKVQQIIIDTEGEFASLREKHDLIIAAANGGDALAHPKTAKILAERLLETRVSAVLDIYDLKRHDREAFVRIFLEALMNVPKHLYGHVLIALDEAHLFAPEKGSGESASTAAVIDIATRGRKRGYCLVAATQRVSKFHKDVAAELLNKFIGRTGLDLDVKRAAFELGMTPKEALSALQHLNAGEFYAFGPAIATVVQLMKSGAIETTHPKVGDRTLRAPPKPTEAIRAILPKLADLPKEAEEEARTVEDLRKENARLKRELAQKPKAGPSPTDVEAAVSQAGELARAAGFAKGRHSGFVDGIEQIAASAESAFTNIHAAARALVETTQRDRKTFEEIVGTAKREASKAGARPENPNRSGLTPSRPAVAVQRTEPNRNRADGARARQIDGRAPLSKAERLVLTVLAQYPQGRTKNQIAILTGYAINGGGFGNALSSLRTKGFIESSRDLLTSTTAGLDALGSFDPLPEGDALLAHWYGQLGKAERATLQVLAEAFPQSLSKEEVAERAGYEAGGGGFGNALSRLRTLELISGRGELRASEDLFG